MRSTMVRIAASSMLAAACGGGGGGGGSTAPNSSTLDVSVPATTMVSGTTMQATATMGGAAASDVTWTSSDRDIVSVSGTGMLIATYQGVAVITATKGSAQGKVTVTVTPGAPMQIRIWAGDLQSAPAGTALKDPLCTIVTDLAGNLIKGIAVTYAVASGGGALAAPTAPTTNAQGIAIAGTWTLGATKGAQTVVASYGSLQPVTFTATAQ